MTRVLIPTGAVGLGFDPTALKRGVGMAPDIIAVDGGSTDSGPHYLGTGTSKYSRATTKAEWKSFIEARAEADAPLVVGTAGTCGTDSTVNWMADITAEIASEMGKPLRVARLYCEQDKLEITRALANDRITALPPEQPLSPVTIDACTHIVALAGAEQIAAALETGADIVIAGRATDTASIAALPIQKGNKAGAAWHGAKIGECGAYCSSRPTSGVIVIDFDKTGFTVEPMASGAVCTPQSVSAHMLYENADPFILHEPGGYLDVSHARYSQIDPRRVRVEGSEWVPAQYTVKLEGASVGGYQTISMALLREPRYVEHAPEWTSKLEAMLHAQVQAELDLAPVDYHIQCRLIGRNATLGELETASSQANETGVLLIATAPTQAMAQDIAKLANPLLLHMPLTEDEPQATFAFPFSPPESNRGAAYTFALNHVLRLDDPMDAFRLEVSELGNGKTG